MAYSSRRIKTKWTPVKVIVVGLLILLVVGFTIVFLIGNPPFVFYGKLVDHEGNPIPKIKINYSVGNITPCWVPLIQSRSSTVKTNRHGKFKTWGVGYKLYITPIKVSGYEFSHDTNPKMSFGYAPPAMSGGFVATEASPFVFTLRKKGMPAYLLVNKGKGNQRILEGVLDAINTSLYLVPPWIDPNGLPGYLPGGEEPKFGQVKRWGGKDLLIEGALSGDGTQYDLEFSPIPSNSGIILSDDFLREAPETGYQPSVQLSVPRGTKGLKKYLYIKLDDEKFYGRLDTEINIGPTQYDNSENKILIDSWINPSGSRNLEFDEAYQSDEQQWRDLLDKLGGYGHFGDYVPTHEEHVAELVEKFGLSSLSDYENEDQFLAELRQLRAAKDAANPQWWHKLEK